METTKQEQTEEQEVKKTDKTPQAEEISETDAAKVSGGVRF